MTHHYRGVELSAIEKIRERSCGSKFDAARARESICDCVRRTMIEHGDVPSHEAGDFHERHRIGARTQDQQLRWQFDGHDEERGIVGVHGHRSAWAAVHRGQYICRQRFGTVAAECGTENESWILARGHEGDAASVMTIATSIDEGKGFVVVRLAQASQQDAHGALASQADPPQHIVRAARIVFGDQRRAALEHLAGSFDQVGFQATTAQQPRSAGVMGNEHLRAGLAIGRADRVNHGGQDQGLAAIAVQVKEFSQ